MQHRKLLPATLETAEFADARKLYEWLELRGLLHEINTSGATPARTLRRWRSGESHAAGFYTVDSLCTHLGFHPSELPGTLWLRQERPADRPNPIVECACGCGERFPAYGEAHPWKPRRYLDGHTQSKRRAAA